MEEALVSFSLWCRSNGLTVFERESAETEVFGRRLHHQEGLIPPFHDEQRTSSACYSTLHLMASIIGGGVFMLPAVFEKCGIISASILILTTAILTERSLYLLCLTARRAGAESYSEVVKIAFGPWAEHTVSTLLFLFLISVLVAYFMLLSDLWAPLLQRILPSQQHTVPDCLLLLTSLILLTPFLVQREFRCVRIKCYSALLSIFLLCLALGLNSKETILSLASKISGKRQVEMQGGRRQEEAVYIQYYPESIGDVLFALPLVTMSFLASPNMLSIQARLKAPTKKRVARVIRGGIASSTVLMVAFGMIGYIAAGTETQGNFLLNLSTLKNANKDPKLLILLVIGRVGCGILMLFATAMVMPHCRHALLQVLDFTILKGTDDDTCKKVKEICPEECCEEDVPDPDEETCMSFPSISTWSTDKSPNDVYVVNPNEETKLLPRIEEEAHIPACNIYSNRFAHYTSTAGIAIASYLGAVALSVAGTNVLTVWSLAGSAAAFLLAFTLPSCCFLQIQRRQLIDSGTSAWVGFCWAIITISGMLTVVCTFQILFSYACNCYLGLFIAPRS